MDEPEADRTKTTETRAAHRNQEKAAETPFYH